MTRIQRYPFQLWLTVIILCAALDARPAGAPPVEHVIIVSVDGLMPEYYLQDNAGQLFPTLALFKQKGSFAEAVTGVLPTLTFPSHTTLITGVTPSKHGITSNLLFDPLRRNQGGWNWYTQDIRATTIWQAARAKGLKTGSVFWPVTVGADIDYLIPAYWRNVAFPDATRLLTALSTPGLLQEIEEKFGAYDASGQTDADRLQIGLYVFERHQPQLMLIKTNDLDGAQHKYGPGSPEAVSMLQEIDRALGQMVAALEQRLEEDTVLAVVSDHGSASIQKVLKPEVYFREKGWVSYADERVTDWKATPVVGGGVCAVVLKDTSDTSTLGEIRDLFQGLLEQGDQGVGRIYEKEEIVRMGGFPEASLLIEASTGFRMSEGSRGPSIEDSKDRGAHGYTPGFAGQDASLLFMGPGVVPGASLGKIPMTSIAPRLAAFLGLELGPSVEKKRISARVKRR